MTVPDTALFGIGHRQHGERPLFWQELLRHELEEAKAAGAVVLVPTGSVEQHGPHLPSDVDIVSALAVATGAAEATRDIRTLVAPPIWTGQSHYKLGHPGTLSISFETYTAVLCDICQSLAANGFPRIILLNGHGGNRALNQAIAIKLAEEGIYPLAITYWDMVPDLLANGDAHDSGSIGHAGDWETSLQLYLRPGLVDMSRAVSGTQGSPFSSDVARWAAFPERRREHIEGVYGDATKALAARGEGLYLAARDRLTTTIRELAALPPRS